ncbi:hypothetical protein DERF_008964 [Dermatophagoides farinae]|uniref:C2H2-type domain-containing protein n=1 Tax=Dermatophagoides farinae TaxID=6954 RepID=A0A922L3J4_DERFA|nr:hypothetical protein DERF_008964 [Dermatophagoides farinae]
MMIVPALSSRNHKILDEYQQQYNMSTKLSNMNGNNYHHQQPFDCQQVEQTPARSNVLSFDHDYFHIDNGHDNTLAFVDQSTTSSSKETRDLCTNPKDSLITINYDNPNDEIGDDDMNIIQNHSEQQNSSSSNENLITMNLTKNKKFPCPKCSFGFDTSRNLDNHRHRRIHTCGTAISMFIL